MAKNIDKLRLLCYVKVTNNKGKIVSTGKYLVKIKIGNFTQTKKMIFVK